MDALLNELGLAAPDETEPVGFIDDGALSLDTLLDGDDDDVDTPCSTPSDGYGHQEDDTLGWDLTDDGHDDAAVESAITELVHCENAGPSPAKKRKCDSNDVISPPRDFNAINATCFAMGGPSPIRPQAAQLQACFQPTSPGMRAAVSSPYYSTQYTSHGLVYTNTAASNSTIQNGLRLQQQRLHLQQRLQAAQQQQRQQNMQQQQQQQQQQYRYHQVQQHAHKQQLPQKQYRQNLGLVQVPVPAQSANRVSAVPVPEPVSTKNVRKERAPPHMVHNAPMPAFQNEQEELAYLRRLIASKQHQMRVLEQQMSSQSVASPSKKRTYVSQSPQYGLVHGN